MNNYKSSMNEEAFKSVIENSTDLTIITDAEGRVTYVSPQCKDVIGYAEEDILGKRMPDFIHPDDKERCRKAWKRDMAGESLQNIEYRILAKKGKERWLSHSAKYVTVDKENVGMQNSIRDITERKQAEERLRESEEKYRVLAENVRDVVFMQDMNLNITYISPSVTSIFGYTVAEVLNMKMENLMTPESLKRALTSFQKYIALAGKGNVDIPLMEYEYIHKDGSTFRGELHVSFLYDVNRLPVGSQGVLRDVTERKLAENASREKEQFLADVFSSIQDGISVLDSNLTIIRVNSKMEEWYSANMPLTGRKCYEAYHNRTKACEICPTLQTLKSGKTETEIVPGLPGSPVKWVELFSFPVKDRATGRVTGVVEFVRDITARRQAEDERRKIEEKLRHTEKLDAIGQLAGGIAHDFNNQLTGIMGYADMLRISLAGNKELRNDAAIIVEAAERTAHLTDQLLAFARKGKYQSVLVNLHDIIMEVISLLKHSIDKRISIRENLKAKHPFTVGDDSQLQNALLNLAINARDAMPKGGKVTFATEEVRLDEKYCKEYSSEIMPGRYIQISVIDTGIGMDKKTEKRIFEPFFTTKEKGKGTGMGLAAVYGTVQSHNGLVSVHSEINHGTTIRLHLPIAVPDGGPDTIQRPTEAVRGEARILVVDDEDIVCKITERMLQSLGYSVSTRKNGSEAVEYYRKSWKNIDCVILDMVMPKLGGQETFLAMKKINPEVKAILSSGFSIDGEAERTLEAGASGFIQKPFQVVELSRKVAEALK